MTRQDFAVTVRPWMGFEETVEPIGAKLMAEGLAKPMTTKCDVAEVGTQIHSIVNQQVSGVFISGDLPTIGNPDCMFVANGRPLVMIEYLDPQRKQADLRELSSLHYYMSLNNVRYGVVTSFSRALFVRLADTNILEASKIADDASFLLSAYVAVCKRAAATPRPEEPPLFSPLIEVYDGQHLKGLLRFTAVDVSAYGQTKICKGEFQRSTGLKPAFYTVYVKCIDLRKTTPSEQLELENEAQIYRELRYLQGNSIPVFYAYGVVGGFLRCLIVEYRGQRFNSVGYRGSTSLLTAN
ncbi:hypothetical protein TRICI_003707 [Trichomonascus ciferrii]|uniref:Uncharacterized protein n=1 Tax=Trichomonascus ciferrii TaxID=44093 RepID=A0A642V2J0_9ASCO|nr:hypothetical protein TRICI_003707 [Trichomonascus ciferrii]